MLTWLFVAAFVLVLLSKSRGPDKCTHLILLAIACIALAK